MLHAPWLITRQQSSFIIQFWVETDQHQNERSSSEVPYKPPLLHCVALILWHFKIHYPQKVFISQQRKKSQEILRLGQRVQIRKKISEFQSFSSLFHFHSFTALHSSPVELLFSCLFLSLGMTSSLGPLTHTQSTWEDNFRWCR